MPVQMEIPMRIFSAPVNSSIILISFGSFVSSRQQEEFVSNIQSKYLTTATMTTIRLQTKVMKATRARNERARRRNKASIQASLADDGRRKSTPPSQSVAAVKPEKLKARISGFKNGDAASQAVLAAEPKKHTILIPGPKKAEASAQTISAGKVKAEEEDDEEDSARVVLARTLPYKPTRLRFTPGKPAVVV